MLQLIETICYENGAFQRIPLHEERMKRSRQQLFGVSDLLSLSRLSIPESLKYQKVKCRITYSFQIEEIAYEPYISKSIKSLKLVREDAIDYSHKYKNRDSLNRLLGMRGVYDEILVVKNGMITDTSFSNIILLKGGTWYTPEYPLLPGTRREFYLRKNQIFPRVIKPEDLGQYEEARLINSMRSLEDADPIQIAGIF
jgi:4-amino-4-deoxychorismate lyase